MLKLITRFLLGNIYFAYFGVVTNTLFYIWLFGIVTLKSVHSIPIQFQIILFILADVFILNSVSFSCILNYEIFSFSSILLSQSTQLSYKFLIFFNCHDKSFRSIISLELRKIYKLQYATYYLQSNMHTADEDVIVPRERGNFGFLVIHFILKIFSSSNKTPQTNQTHS